VAAGPATKKRSTRSLLKFCVLGLGLLQYEKAFASGGGNICDNDTDFAAVWLGLGGFNVTGANLGNQNNIAQVGVDTYASCSDQGAYAWVEWFPAKAVMLFTVSPGDDIHVFIQSLTATSASFFIADMTIPQTAGYVIHPPKGFKLVGNEAEYIVERPRGDSTPTGRPACTRWRTTSGLSGMLLARKISQAHSTTPAGLP
jgi:peptidase A4-like protein